MQGEADVTRRRKLLEAIRSGLSVTKAAKASGYGRSHAYRLVKSCPEMSRLIASRPKVGGQQRLEPDPVAPADDPLCVRMMAVLESIAEDTDASAQSRVSSAKAVLDLMAKARVAPVVPAIETKTVKPRVLSADEVAARLKVI